MADLVNPYANPYLPAFVNQRPRVNDAANLAMPQNYLATQTFSQIHSVKGFEGADSYVMGLSNGSSEIVSDSDPNLARIYVTAKDGNGQTFVQAFDLVSVERPKPVTMDDLSAKMNELLNRMNKLEEDKRNAKPNYVPSDKNQRRASGLPTGTDNRSAQNSTESAVTAAIDGAE